MPNTRSNPARAALMPYVTMGYPRRESALANGMSLALCLEQAATLRAAGVAVPLVLMSYYNPILQMGPEAFARRAAAAGIDGTIIPDLPPEEADELCAALGRQGIAPVFLLPPDLEAFVARVRGITRLPLAVGFGISTPG